MNMILKKIALTLAFILSATTISANEKMVPSPLLMMDELFSHHVLIAEKSTHQLHLYEFKNDRPQLIRTYDMATGKKAGDKIFQGDHRTPEGIYHFVDFLTHADLIKRHGEEKGKIYGVGAFVMNYPNIIDSREKKTGSGIWLHSTNDETRIEKGLDSRGCIVTANTHLIDIAKYIELYKTPIVVVHDLKFLKESTWRKKRQKVAKTINDWLDAWRSEDIKKYIEQYHEEFNDPNRGNKSQFRQYKRAVFSQPGQPLIDIKNVNVFQVDDYAVATFQQAYESNTIQDLGKKTLYLKRDAYYNWKIVSEQWSKHGIDSDSTVAFQPSMRFFKTQNPVQIMGDLLENPNGNRSEEGNN
ncbi:MAG: L,D-transpeptidase family protein [Oligoflexia bacterium]|nr:L,D-transpeptidase family protein [Oligoflexia bacterium]